MASSPAKWDREVDVVSVGSGVGGISAAIFARDAGKTAMVLEKAPKLGGVSAYSGGEVFLPNNHVAAAAGISDSREEGVRYLDFLAAGYAEPVLRDNLLDVGPVAIRHLEEKAGVRWKVIEGFPDYHYPVAPGTAKAGRYLEVELFDGATLGEWQHKTYLSPHMPNGITHDEMFAWGGFPHVMKWDFALMSKRFRRDMRGFGPGMMGYFIKAAIDRNVSIEVETPACELCVEGGVVVGVRATQGGRDLLIRAREAVVLAAGGYDWHPDLPRYFEQAPEWQSLVMPSVEGDAMVTAAEIGGAIAAVPPCNLGVFFGYNVPGDLQEGKPLWRASWEGGFPHAIWVNRAGARFADESFYRDYLPKTKAWDGASQTQPNFPPYLIFDQTFRDKYPLGAFLPGQDIPESLLARADTLMGLAEKLGISPEGLEATVSRFNGFAAEGKDHDFGRGTYPWAAMMTGDRDRPNPNLGPLLKAPYYGLRLRIASVGINAAGLRTNEHAQVMHVRGRPIEGLYAVGNSAAQLDIGAGYQSGLANLRGIVGAYLAVKNARPRA